MPITGLEDDLRAIAIDVLETAAQDLMDDLMDSAPVGETGELLDSAFGPEIDEDNLTAELGFTAPQADWTDQGTNPHDIFPVNADNLTFFWENGFDGPGVYSFKHVSHPGYSGSNWFSDKIDDWQGYVDRAAGEI